MKTAEEDLDLFYYDPHKWYQQRVQHMSPSRRWAYDFFEIQSTWPAVAFGLLTAIAVVVSVVLVILESHPLLEPYFSNQRGFQFIIDMVVFAIFVVELTGRLYGAPDRIKFFKSFMNWIDIVTIVPFIVEIFIGDQEQGRFVEFLRLLRVLRLLHGINPRHGNISVMITFRAIRQSTPQIFAVLFYIVILIIITASFMFLAEQEVKDPETGMWMRTVNGELSISPFQSIVHSFYWAVTTLTTTGYGDTTPISPAGKTLAGVSMFLGLMVAAFATSILGSHFLREWTLHHRIKFQQRLREKKRRALSLKLFTNKKSQEIGILQADNERLTDTVAEVQRLLAEVNPPYFYEQYKRINELYKELEKENKKLHMEVEQLREQLKLQAGNGLGIRRFFSVPVE
jgi:voltage-gated potassium channel Kch/cell division protein FtsB